MIPIRLSYVVVKQFLSWLNRTGRNIVVVSFVGVSVIPISYYERRSICGGLQIDYTVNFLLLSYLSFSEKTQRVSCFQVSLL